jgi:uncharacterized membrane protein YqiK
MHIDYKKAPMIIQRFGDVKKLVEQTLDPMVSAFFKNIAQKMTLIELLQNRAAIQEESGNEMKARFEAYSLELQEVLIGTPRAAAGDRTIEDILFQLRSRQVAREQVTTFQEQEKAAVQERTLNEAKATAAAQIALTQSLIQIRRPVRDRGSRARARRTGLWRSALRMPRPQNSPSMRMAAPNIVWPNKTSRASPTP